MLELLKLAGMIFLFLVLLMISDKQIFERYEKVRSSGKYNMITEANDAMDEAGLKPCDYYYAMFNYELLKRKYGEKKNDATTKSNKR